MMIDVDELPGFIASMVKRSKTLGDRMMEEERNNLRKAAEAENLAECFDNIQREMPEHEHKIKSEHTEPDGSLLNILQEAQAVVDGQRRDDYGDMDQSFLRIAGMWSGYLGVNLDKYDVAHMMIMLKLSRACGKFHRDSYVDAAGYAYCAEKMNKSDLEDCDKSEFFTDY